jgi:hypothetical protein
VLLTKGNKALKNMISLQSKLITSISSCTHVAGKIIQMLRPAL